MTTQAMKLHTPKLKLSGLTIDTGEVLFFAFRGETITEVLEDFELDDLRGLMEPWRATLKDGTAEVWTIYTGPYIGREEILAILPPCELVKAA